ncbi:MAG: DUF1674 domain-containing protein [Hellea sp.]|nr:DUF1674 domain-containing protein [Hellea sp.]
MGNKQAIKNYEKAISPAAQRALKEAEERRKLRHKKEAELAEEKGGPKGAEPTRYGDWERNGIAYDF